MRAACPFSHSSAGTSSPPSGRRHTRRCTTTCPTAVRCVTGRRPLLAQPAAGGGKRPLPRRPPAAASSFSRACWRNASPACTHVLFRVLDPVPLPGRLHRRPALPQKRVVLRVHRLRPGCKLPLARFRAHAWPPCQTNPTRNRNVFCPRTLPPATKRGHTPTRGESRAAVHAGSAPATLSGSQRSSVHERSQPGSLFKPASVAVIGASNSPTSIGGIVMRNLLKAGFSGPIMPVNPKYPAVAGVLTYPDVAHLPVTPDVAVICTPPATVPGLIQQLGERGTRAAIVITAGLSSPTRPGGPTIQQAMLDAARPHLLRILGPNCVGLARPGHRPQCDLRPRRDRPRARSRSSRSPAGSAPRRSTGPARGIGFSHFVSLGNSADIDFGDVLDYLAQHAGDDRDPAVHGVDRGR